MKEQGLIKLNLGAGKLGKDSGLGATDGIM